MSPLDMLTLIIRKTLKACRVYRPGPTLMSKSDFNGQFQGVFRTCEYQRDQSLESFNTWGSVLFIGI